MSAAESNCPVCNETFLQRGQMPAPGPISSKAYECLRCGTFVFDERISNIKGFNEIRHLISAWIRRQNNMGREWPVVGDSNPKIEDWFTQLENMGLPKTTDEKMKALLQAYADTTEYEEVIKVENHPELISEVAARNLKEVIGLNHLLQQLDYIEYPGSHDRNSARIKAKGWLRVDELRKTSVSSDSAFVAMWFEDSITRVYREAVTKAVGECGYYPIFIDQEKFNGFIMDQVVTLIRQSRFIIADYTTRPEQYGEDQKLINGVRGGVYWESGFAYGLGKPVIHTCENDEEAKRRVHFDVDQYKMIYWKRNDLGASIGDLTKPIVKPNFMEELAMHILATVGKGSYVQKK